MYDAAILERAVMELSMHFAMGAIVLDALNRVVLNGVSSAPALRPMSTCAVVRLDWAVGMLIPSRTEGRRMQERWYDYELLTEGVRCGDHNLRDGRAMARMSGRTIRTGAGAC